jgi:hypothetical protein
MVYLGPLYAYNVMLFKLACNILQYIFKGAEGGGIFCIFYETFGVATLTLGLS